MKNIKERISYFGKMILVFPEAFLAKLTKPKSRGEFDDTASAVAGLFLIVSLMSLSILFFVNWLTSYGGKNEGTFSDGASVIGTKLKPQNLMTEAPSERSLGGEAS